MCVSYLENIMVLVVYIRQIVVAHIDERSLVSRRWYHDKMQSHSGTDQLSSLFLAVLTTSTNRPMPVAPYNIQSGLFVNLFS